MKLKPYKKTKPSGVEWLGDVPEHWEDASLRRFATRYSGGTPDRSNETFWEEGMIPWINSGAVNQGLVVEPSAFITEDAFRYSSAKWVRAGDLVMALAGQGKTKGMVAQMGIDSTCNQSMAAICAKPPLQPRYLFWLLVSQYEHIRNMAGGEQRDGLNLEILGDIPCLKLPDDEQAAIAAFLDRETGRIDALVAKKRELVERLKEKRTALISRTVTHGLPPAAAKAAGLPVNPKMKDSGIEWLGEIPEHWEVAALKHLVSIPIIDGPHESPIKQDDGIPFVSAEAVANGSIDFGKIWGYITEEDHKRFSRRYKPKRGDVLLIKLGATTGTAAIVDTDEDFNIWVPLAAIRLRAKMKPNLLLHILRSRNLRDAYQLYWTFGTQQTLGLKTISELRIPVPPLPEQTAIAAYLDTETAKLDALVAKVEEAVERLQEYRSALITAAVTGKIDVRKEIQA